MIKGQSCSVSLQMQAAIIDMAEHDGLQRFPGGFWSRPGDARDPAVSYGTSTVEALVNRYMAKYREWHHGRNGAFPVSVDLVAPHGLVSCCHRTPRGACFSVQLLGGFLAVWDLCAEDGPSVTNDVDKVLERLAQIYGPLGGRLVLYQDSSGRWDEIEHGPGGFRRFVPIEGPAASGCAEPYLAAWIKWRQLRRLPGFKAITWPD